MRTTIRGFTVLELFVVISIVAILFVIGFGAYQGLLGRVDLAQCASNMKSLNVAFAGYMQDHDGKWPVEARAQKPDWIDIWWIITMTPYGATEKTWQCPTLRRQMLKADKQQPRIHYMPSYFGREANAAYKWPKQPWLMEIGNMHGNGALLSFPDGSVRSLDEILADQSQKK